MNLDGTKIKQLRKEAKVKRKDLAAGLEMSESGLGKIEKGQTTVSVKHIDKIAKTIDKPFLYVFDYLSGAEVNDYLKELDLSKERLTALQHERADSEEELRRVIAELEAKVKLQEELIGTLKDMVEFLKKNS